MCGGGLGALTLPWPEKVTCVFQHYATDDIKYVRDAILDMFDDDGDGKINKEELTLLLLQQGRLAEQDINAGPSLELVENSDSNSDSDFEP